MINRFLVRTAWLLNEQWLCFGQSVDVSHEETPPQNWSNRLLSSAKQLLLPNLETSKQQQQQPFPGFTVEGRNGPTRSRVANQKGFYRHPSKFNRIILIFGTSAFGSNLHSKMQGSTNKYCTPELGASPPPTNVKNRFNQKRKIGQWSSRYNHKIVEGYSPISSFWMAYL